MLLEYFLLTLTFVVGHGRIVNFEEEGGLPDEMSDDTAWKNGNLMNVTLNSLLPGICFKIFSMYNFNLPMYKKDM